MEETLRPGTPKLDTVAAYVPYPWEHAVTWLRVAQPLQQAGLKILRGSEGGIHPELVAQADAVVIQREFPAYSRAAYAQIIQGARVQNKPVIYEIDDLLLDLPPEHPDHQIHYYTYALLPMLRAICEADLVSVTTPALKSYVQQLNPNTCVLPNYLDDLLWQPKSVIASEAISEAAQSPTRPKVTISYMGSVTHVPDLAEITPALLRLVERYPGRLLFKFWGAPPPLELEACASVEWIAKELPSYPQFSKEFSQQQCDIFIAPLVNSFFNQCKSSIKFLEYSIQGVPGVYSRIAPYEAVVQHGENGMLAFSLDEWESSLAELIESQERRLAMGQKAQESALKYWRLSDHAHEWLEAYKTAQMNAIATSSSQLTSSQL